MTIGTGYEEIVGVSQAQVDAYCSMTGDDPITVYGALSANGIVVHGDEPSELDTHVVGAPWWQQSPLTSPSGTSGSVPARRGRRPGRPGESEEETLAARDREEAQAAADMAEAQAAMQAEEAAMALAVEQQARSRGAVAKVSTGGGCRCPKCNAQLKLILAPPPAVAPGRPAGVVAARKMVPGQGLQRPSRVPVSYMTPGQGLQRGSGGLDDVPVISGEDDDVFGAPRPASSGGRPRPGAPSGGGGRPRPGAPSGGGGRPGAPPKRKNYISGDEIDVFGAPVAKKMAVRPALRAATPGSCLCSCPNCGTVLCLSVGPGGYDAKKVNAQLPNMYAAAAQAIHGDITVFGSDGGGLFPGQIGFDPATINY